MKVKSRLPGQNGKDAGIKQEANEAGTSPRTPRKVDPALMRRLASASGAVAERERGFLAARELYAAARERVELVREIIQAKYGLGPDDGIQQDGTIVPAAKV